MKSKYQMAIVGVIAVTAISWIVMTEQIPSLRKRATSVDPPQDPAPKSVAPEDRDEITEVELSQIFNEAPNYDQEELSPTVAMYIGNHLMYNDPTAPCNQGTEGLKSFIEHFCADETFQKERIKLAPSEEPIPPLTASDLTISKPDSTGYFSGWKEVSADDAIFCTGWMDAEAELFYHFQRQPSGKWYLVDYMGDL